MNSEELFRQQVKAEVQAMRKAFTFQEHMSIAFTPHVILDTIWFYADKVQAYCRDHRISHTLKLSRALNYLRKSYTDELRKDLTLDQISQIHEKAEEWRSLNQSDFTIMFFAISNSLLREYASQDYNYCMNWAYTAIKLCQLAKDYNDELNKMIQERISGNHDLPAHPVIDKLSLIMDAYLPQGFQVEDTQIDLCIKIFRNNLNKIHYDSNN